MQCPASLRLHVDNGTSPEAAQGTVAHAVLERVLLEHIDHADAAIGEQHVIEEGLDSHEIFVDQDMADAVTEAVEYVRDVFARLQREGEEPELLVETRVDISRWTPIRYQGGTADVIIVGRTTLAVLDYKHGQGVFVPVEDNPQLLLYGLGAYNEYDGWNDFERVEIHVMQPRMHNMACQKMTLAELLVRGEYIKSRLALASSMDAPFGPGDACTFCSRKPTCPALAEHVAQIVSGAFGDLDSETVILPDPENPPQFEVQTPPREYGPEQLAELWARTKLVEGWVKAVKDEAQRRLLAREALPGLKLVEGRGSRDWLDEYAARNALTSLGLKHNQVVEIKTVSPAKAEKLLPKKEREKIQSLITKKRGSATVALASDKREEWKPVEGEVFDDLEDDDDCGL